MGLQKTRVLMDGMRKYGSFDIEGAVERSFAFALDDILREQDNCLRRQNSTRWKQDDMWGKRDESGNEQDGFFRKKGNLWSNQLHGSSMMYTLMILLIVGSMLGMLVMVNGLQGHYESQVMDQVWARHNLESGINRYLSQDFQAGQEIYLPLFKEQGPDSIHLKTESWGMFGLILAEGIYGKTKESQPCLVGQQLFSQDVYSLWLEDLDNPLNLAGNIELEGKLYLPKAGLKPAFLNGKAYQGKTAWPGIHESRSIRPQFNWQKWNEIRGQLLEIRTWQLEEGGYKISSLNIKQDWTKEKHLIQSAASILLDDIRLEGKCLIQANEVILGPNAHLKNSLIFTRKLKILEGFQGSFQAFVLEDIELENSVQLNYPSVLALLPDSNKACRFDIGENFTIEGQLILSRDVFRSLDQREDYFQIGQGSHIWGSIFSSQSLDFKGNMHGSLVAQQLVHLQEGRIYRNFLVDASININELSRDFVGILSQANTSNQIATWLKKEEN
ncbi:MAG: hypothetical protein MRZ79_07980 [Bacteroidia bacterium]|nr:hypothetical protein [Bacteroidia bacterium]